MCRRAAFVKDIAVIVIAEGGLRTLSLGKTCRGTLTIVVEESLPGDMVVLLKLVS